MKTLMGLLFGCAFVLLGAAATLPMMHGFDAGAREGAPLLVLAMVVGWIGGKIRAAHEDDFGNWRT